MSLQVELETVQAAWAERSGPEVAAMMAAANDSLLPLAARALKAGDQFPRIALEDPLGRAVDIPGLAAISPVVVTFYRGGWCPYCNLELRAYQKLLPDIEALGGKLVAISPEAPDNSLSTAEKNALSFPVLSDAEGRLADALGIRFELSEAVKAYFIGAGLDLPARNGDGRWSLPIPATYVVGRDGRIVLAHVDPDYRKRLEPAAVIDALAHSVAAPQSPSRS